MGLGASHAVCRGQPSLAVDRRHAELGDPRPRTDSGLSVSRRTGRASLSAAISRFTISGMTVRRAVILLAVEYQDAFTDLAGIHLKDSWVLDIAPTAHGVTFRLKPS